MARRGPEKPSEPDEDDAPDRRRLDLWLWCARMARTRTLAVRLVDAGHVRVNGQRTRAAGKPIKIGDVLTIALEREARVLRVADLGERRGPFEEARMLYEDLAPRGETRNDIAG